jgi:hypothetical protein
MFVLSQYSARNETGKWQLLAVAVEEEVEGKEGIHDERGRSTDGDQHVKSRIHPNHPKSNVISFILVSSHLILQP